MAWKSGWKYRKKITIDKTQVGGATHTDFPVYVHVDADPDLARAQADGEDILFTESDGITLCPYECESWTGGGGSAATADFWTKVASVSHVADPEIYLYYGTAGASSHSNETATWNANYILVTHDLLTDSTGNGHSFTDTGTADTRMSL